ncbi:MAG: response regulator [Pseudomonadota bacterium]
MTSGSDLPGSVFAGIRARMLLLVLVILVPVIALYIQYATVTREIGEQREINELQTMSREMAAATGRISDATAVLIESIARLPEIRQLDPDACRKTMSNLLERLPRYANITVSGPNGDIVCDGQPGTGKKASVADRGYFKDALDSHSAVVGNPTTGLLNGEAILPVAFAMREADGRVRFVVSSLIRLGWIANDEARTKTRTGVALFFLDAEGRILAGFPSEQDRVGKGLAVVSPLLHGQESALVTGGLGFDQRPRRYALDPVKLGDYRFWVAATLSEDELFGALERAFSRNMLALALLTALALLLAWFLAGRLVRQPLVQLIGVSQRLRAGDFSARVGGPRMSGEIGVLMAEYDLTAADLEMREQERGRRELEIKGLNRVLRMVGNCNQVLVHARDEPQLLESFCRHIAQDGAYLLVWVGMLRPTTRLGIDILAHFGDDQGYLNIIQLSWGDGAQGQEPASRAVRDAKPLIERYLPNEGNPGFWHAESVKRGFHSSIALPLLSHGETIGVLSVYAADPQAFSEAEKHLFEELAADLAYGIAALNSQAAREKAEAELREYQQLLEQRVAERTAQISVTNDELQREITDHQIAEEALRKAAAYDQTQRKALALFNSVRERNEILQGVFELLATEQAFPVAAYYGYDEWRGVFSVQASWSLPAGTAREVHVGEGLIGQVAQTGQALLLDGITEKSSLAIDTGLYSLVPEAVLMVPVVFQQQRFGVLVLASSRQLGLRDRDFVDQLASQLGVALHNLSQHENLQLLASQLRTRGEEITRQNLQLEQASRMKSEFLANMSHELRTPLNAIIGFSEILKENLVGQLTPQQQGLTQDIYSSGEHLLSLINDILDLSKVEAGYMTLDMEGLSIAALCTNSLSIVKERALTHRVQLEGKFDPDLPEIVADPRKVKQIVYNLLSNAIKFTAEGGKVSLDLRRAFQPVAPAAGTYFGAAIPAADYLEIVVSDTGIGINAKDMPSLFEPFVQLDSALSKQYEGTGLGLAMVRRLVELHGGALAVQSTLGEGSRFSVWLPYRRVADMPIADALAAGAVPVLSGVADDSVAAFSSNSRSLPQAGVREKRRCRVLIVEDDDQAAQALRLQLEAAGIQVMRAITGEQALETALTDPPDAITLDIMLPGMDGWDVLARLKGAPQLAHIPVLIVSILADTGKGVSLGATQVLQKPVSRQDLAEAFARIGIQTGPRKTARILVVDDDPKAVRIICTHLEQDGFSVECAYSGYEGIAAARIGRPDAVILDLVMPELSGFEVVEALKADTATVNIPIIVMTSKMLTLADRAVLNGHIATIIEKSAFRPEMLTNEIHRLLQMTIPKEHLTQPAGVATVSSERE